MFACHFGTLGVLGKDSIEAFTDTFMGPSIGGIFAPSESAHTGESLEFNKQQQLNQMT